MGKVLGDDGSGSQDSIANGIVWASRSGARVISMSLGSPQESSVIRQAVQYAIQSGVVVVASAGNDGGNRTNYPAGTQGVRAISALDKNMQKAHFASWGAHIYAACPGVDVKSTMPTSKGGYGLMSGTSMAGPVCAAAIALSIASGKPIKWKNLG